jgi:hypothetical protein
VAKQSDETLSSRNHIAEGSVTTGIHVYSCGVNVCCHHVLVSPLRVRSVSVHLGRLMVVTNFAGPQTLTKRLHAIGSIRCPATAFGMLERTDWGLTPFFFSSGQRTCSNRVSGLVFVDVCEVLRLVVSFCNRLDKAPRSQVV